MTKDNHSGITKFNTLFLSDLNASTDDEVEVILEGPWGEQAQCEEHEDTSGCQTDVDEYFYRLESDKS